MATPNRERIYIRLLDEGTDVWRPTEAEAMADGAYRILPTPDYDPDDEKWQFPPGSRVIGEKRKLFGREVLVAVRPAEAGRRIA